MNRRRRVLVCPLDWGLGHAARCVPVIEKFIELGAEVIIAVDKGPYAFLHKEFPNLSFICYPGLSISYPASGSMALKMLMSLPGILKGIYNEHRFLKWIIKKNDIDVVISDNRYGLWNKHVYCVFITHQLMIKSNGIFKILEPLLYRINKWFIHKYNECWIPDFAGENNLSGDLSHKSKFTDNVYFIDPLSRFNKFRKSVSRIQGNIINEPEGNNDSQADVLVILSGPEPQRTILEDKIKESLNGLSSKKVVIVRGKADENERINVNDNLIIYSHLETEQMYHLIESAEYIICRPGYSSIMDLALFGKRVIFIPTLGQTEQEYLADYLFKKEMFYYEKQKEFNLLSALENAKNYDLKLTNYEYGNDLLEQRIIKIIRN